MVGQFPRQSVQPRRARPIAPAAQPGQPAPASRVAQSDPGDLSVRLDRMETALRQLTGTIEQLQYRNQQLEMQLKRMQDDTSQQQGSRRRRRAAGSGHAAGRSARQRAAASKSRPALRRIRSLAASECARRAAHARQSVGHCRPRANAGHGAAGRCARRPRRRRAARSVDNGRQFAAAGDGRAARSGRFGQRSANAGTASAGSAAADTQCGPGRPAGQQLATLPPSASPQDEYDMAYGYVLHKDYALAEQAFRDFLKKHPNEHLVPDAQYWLGESLFQQQHYRDAAESFLGVSTKFEHSGKAPDALLRLGQSLAAMNQKEAACATLAEIGRKYPRASAGVKRGVAQEQKRAHC